MRIFKSFVTAIAISALATTSFAGGLANEIMEAPVAMEDEMIAAAGPSIDPTLIVLGILGLLLLGASSSEGGDSNECSIQSRACVFDLEMSESEDL